MATVRDLMKLKGDTQLVTIAPDKSVLEAVQLMADKDIGSLIILDGKSFAGIVTERDYARKIIFERRSSSDTLVEEIMRKRVQCVGPDADIDVCGRIMVMDCIRYVPVVEGDCLLGLISIRDIARHAVSARNSNQPAYSVHR